MVEDDYRKILKYIAKKISSIIYEKQDHSLICRFIDCDSVHMLNICSRDKTEDDVRQQVLSDYGAHPFIASCEAYFKMMQQRAKDGYVMTALQQFFTIPAETLLVEADLDVE